METIRPQDSNNFLHNKYIDLFTPNISGVAIERASSRRPANVMLHDFLSI